MKPSAFTVLHNDVLEGRWRRSNGARAQNTERSLSLSLSLRSLGGNSAASYLTLCDWNTSSTRLWRAVWWYLYLCQRNTGTKKSKTLSPSQHKDVCVCVPACDCIPCFSGCIYVGFLQWRWFHSLPFLSFFYLFFFLQIHPPQNYSRLFGSVNGLRCFSQSLHKSQVFSTCYLPKVALFQSSIVSLMEARRH